MQQKQKLKYEKCITGGYKTDNWTRLKVENKFDHRHTHSMPALRSSSSPRTKFSFPTQKLSGAQRGVYAHTLTFFNKLLTGVTGIMWVAGLLIAGSDNPYMPWVNIMGLILFFVASLMLGKLIQPFKQNPDLPVSNKLRHKIVLKPVKSNCLCLKTGVI